MPTQQSFPILLDIMHLECIISIKEVGAIRKLTILLKVKEDVSFNRVNTGDILGIITRV